ncbi:MAG TPA: polysaccharide biosynthesis tyrosine autokinase [Steroidobacteraceae bacterium]|nr:polysaccharide biosynthesis tyrosine autokinase [Steroidobacteraceae bacterium]
MSARTKAQPLEGTPYEALGHELRIGSILAAAGKLDSARIGEVLRLQQTRHGLRFGEAAISLGLITREDLHLALARQYDFPCQRLNGSTVSPDLIVFRDAPHPSVERLKALRTRLLIRWSSPGSEPRALAIVSPGSCEGRSYLAANLAVLFAQLGMRTLLIDADLRAPRQCRIFDIADRGGLSAVLSGRAAGEVPLPGFGPLAVMPAGALPPNPQELLLRPALATYLELARAQYDVVLIDTPPAGDSADAHSVAFSAGSALVLARTHHTRLDDAAVLARDLTDAGALVLGAVLTTF